MLLQVSVQECQTDLVTTTSIWTRLSLRCDSVSSDRRFTVLVTYNYRGILQNHVFTNTEQNTWCYYHLKGEFSQFHSDLKCIRCAPHARWTATKLLHRANSRTHQLRSVGEAAISFQHWITLFPQNESSDYRTIPNVISLCVIDTNLTFMVPTKRVLFFSAFAITRYCRAAGSLRRCHGEEVSLNSFQWTIQFLPLPFLYADPYEDQCSERTKTHQLCFWVLCFEISIFCVLCCSVTFTVHCSCYCIIVLALCFHCASLFLYCAILT
jgi:hypothetical protein